MMDGTVDGNVDGPGHVVMLDAEDSGSLVLSHAGPNSSLRKRSNARLMLEAL